MAHDNHSNATEKQSVTGLRSSFWFIIILLLLFIAAVNFVNVMGSSGHEEGHGEANSGAHAPTQPTMEATTHEGLPGETGIGRPQEGNTTQYQGAADSNNHDTRHSSGE